MIKHTESFYNKFSTVYPVVDFFLKPQKKVLLEKVNGQPHGTLLEIGVGNGSHLHLYNKHKVTGIDTSAQMLELAYKRNRIDAQLLKMNGEEMSFDGASFDYVVLSHVIAVVEDPDKLLGEVCRVLQSGGKLFILNHFTPDNCLKYVDRAFSVVSRSFHFRSDFSIDNLSALGNFTLVEEVSFGKLSYFKLLIYNKK